MTRYRCLVLDHDDTSVQSTPTVHYPAYVETMRRLRPQLTPATREEFIRLWFESRFMETCRDVYHFTPEEMQLHIVLVHLIDLTCQIIGKQMHEEIDLGMRALPVLR